jgi:TonB family protein
VIDDAGAAGEASRAGTVHTSRGARPIVFACALAVSVLVHAAILIALLPGGRAGMPAAKLPELRASLVQAPVTAEAISEVPARISPVLTAMPDRSPLTMPLPARAPPLAPSRTASTSRAGVDAIEVPAAPLADRTRLGGWLVRQGNEFQTEVDRPVRVDGKLVARYPDQALAEGREDSVVLWIVVGASGSVDEVYLVEGTEEFGAEAVAAVRAARFMPAEDNLVAIRYPIALQFDFRAGVGTSARAK